MLIFLKTTPHNYIISYKSIQNCDFGLINDVIINQMITASI